MMERSFLGLSALLWLPYGLYCFVNPGFLEQAAGVAFVSPTGRTELQAMYGGLQTAMGVLALAGAFRPALTRYALVTLAVLCSGLFLARALGAFAGGGLSAYTNVGLGFELFSLVVAVGLLRRPRRPA